MASEQGRHVKLSAQIQNIRDCLLHGQEKNKGTCANISVARQDPALGAKMPCIRQHPATSTKNMVGYFRALVMFAFSFYNVVNEMQAGQKLPRMLAEIKFKSIRGRNPLALYEARELRPPQPLGGGPLIQAVLFNTSLKVGVEHAAQVSQENPVTQKSGKKNTTP